MLSLILLFYMFLESLVVASISCTPLSFELRPGSTSFYFSPSLSMRFRAGTTFRRFNAANAIFFTSLVRTQHCLADLSLGLTGLCRLVCDLSRPIFASFVTFAHAGRSSVDIGRSFVSCCDGSSSNHIRHRHSELSHCHFFLGGLNQSRPLFLCYRGHYSRCHRQYFDAFVGALTPASGMGACHLPRLSRPSTSLLVLDAVPSLSASISSLHGVGL